MATFTSSTEQFLLVFRLTPTDTLYIITLELSLLLAGKVSYMEDGLFLMFSVVSKFNNMLIFLQFKRLIYSRFIVFIKKFISQVGVYGWHLYSYNQLMSSSYSGNLHTNVKIV